MLAILQRDSERYLTGITQPSNSNPVQPPDVYLSRTGSLFGVLVLGLTDDLDVRDRGGRRLSRCLRPRRWSP